MSANNQNQMPKNNSDRVFINFNIKTPTVLCIDENGKNIGVISTSEAIRLAHSAGLDLLQISPPSHGKPPTAKILDYSKFKFEQSKKKKEEERKQRAAQVVTKEIKFRPTTSSNDLQIKARKALEFLNDGCLVKISIVFINKRELNHPEVAGYGFEEFMSFLPEVETTSDLFRNGVFDTSSLTGKTISFMVRKKQ